MAAWWSVDGSRSINAAVAVAAAAVSVSVLVGGCGSGKVCSGKLKPLVQVSVEHCGISCMHTSFSVSVAYTQSSSALPFNSPKLVQIRIKCTCSSKPNTAAIGAYSEAAKTVLTIAKIIKQHRL